MVYPHFAWHTILIDVIGLLPPCSSRHRYIIVVIDGLTKWVEARAIRYLGVVTTARFILEDIIYCSGFPQFIKTNNGTNFASHDIPKLNKLMAIQGVLTTLYHPEANGTVECANGTLGNIFWKLAQDFTSTWSQLVSSCAFAYNISIHSSTGFSPFQLMFGRHPSLPPVLHSLLDDQKYLSYTTYL